MLISTEPKPLPFLPEDLITARKRYPKAVKKLFNIGRIKFADAQRPGENRDHVFDFETGLRLIISTDWAPLNKEGERGPFEHVSASWDPDNIKLRHGAHPISVLRQTYSYISKRSPREGPFFEDIVPESGVLHMLFTSNFSLEDFNEEGSYIEKNLVNGV